MSRYQKGKTNLDFTEARDRECQWHQLSHMQACTSLQTDNHASTPPLSFFKGWVPFLPPNQQGEEKRISGEAYENKQTVYTAPKLKIKSMAHYAPEPAWGINTTMDCASEDSHQSQYQSGPTKSHFTDTPSNVITMLHSLTVLPSSSRSLHQQ